MMQTTESITKQIKRIFQEADIANITSELIIQNEVAKLGKPTINSLYERSKERLESMGLPVLEPVLLNCVVIYYNTVWGNYKIN